MERTEYRWDLQGVRALSVLFVFMYHLDAQLAPAGFFGVDTFFVVSGFVITRLLLREIEQSNTIDVVSFYARRAKRLLPNASLVLIATLFAAVILLPGFTVRDLSGDVVASALYYANFHFAKLSLDYFSSNRAPSAVVHFWSLSIEEQFYFIWPPLMLAATLFAAQSKRRDAFGLLLTAVISASFAYCLITVRSNQPLAFFHTATRIWELAVGALVAVHAPLLAQILRPVREAAAAFGLALCIGSFALFTEAATHPGYVTVLPVLGVVLLIATAYGTPANEQTSVARLLASKALIWIGDRSYSLYLWHWPVIVLTKAMLGDGAGALALAACTAVILSLIAYTYVETPLRHSDWGLSKKVWLAQAAVLIAIVCGAAQFAPTASALWSRPDRAEWEERLRLASNDDGQVYHDKCHRGDETDQPPCIYGDTSSDKVVVVFGDSHAAHWYPAFNKAAQKEGWKLHSWSKSSCPSALIRLWNPHKKTEYTECDQWRENIFARLRAAPRPYLVVLSSSAGYTGWTIGPDGRKDLTAAQADAEFVRGLTATVKLLQSMGHKVAIMRDTPVARATYKDCIVEFGASAKCSRPRDEALNPKQLERSVIKAVSDVALIDVTDQICDKDNCLVVIDGQIAYRDDSHMTAKFNERFAPVISDLLKGTKLPETFTRN